MGQLILPNAARIYIDTVTVIYAVEQNPTYGALLNPLWNSLQTGNLEVLTSELTLMETLIMPLRNSDTFLIDAYERLLRSPQMQLIPISQTILREAARLRATTPSLRTPDQCSIHAITPRFTLQVSQQCRSIQNNRHSPASRFAASWRSTINSSAKLRSFGTWANRAFNRCFTIACFSNTNRPASSRATSVSPSSNPNNCRNAAGITNLPWRPKCTSTDLDELFIHPRRCHVFSSVPQVQLYGIFLSKPVNPDRDSFFIEEIGERSLEFFNLIKKTS